MTVEPVRIRVGGPAGYDVVVGNGLLGELAPLLGAQTARVAVVHPRALRATGEAIRADLERDGFQAVIAEIPDGEEAKDIRVASFLWGVLGQAGFTRSDALVAVGGYHRPGRVRRRDVVARCPRRPPPDDAACHGRRGSRGQDRDRHS